MNPAFLLLPAALAAATPAAPASLFRAEQLCGAPVAEVEALKASLAELPPSLPEEQRRRGALERLEAFLKLHPMPRTGGCHPTTSDWAVDPAQAAALARGDREAVKLFEKAAEALRADDFEKGLWQYRLAELHGFKGRRGKAALRRADGLMEAWLFSHSWEVLPREARDVRVRLGLPPLAMELLLDAEDDLSHQYLVQVRVPSGAFTRPQFAWLRTALALAYACCWETDPVVKRPPSLERVRALTLDERFRRWAGGEVAGALDELAADYGRVAETDLYSRGDSDDPFWTGYQERQLRFRTLLLKRFKLKELD